MNNESYDYDDDFEHAADAFERNDYKTAYKSFLPLAEQGDAVAQYCLGIMYDEGQGVLQDYKQALKWYRLSAEQGDSYSQYKLGMSYYKRAVVPQDYVSAHMWLNLSATNGRKYAVGDRDKVEKKMTPQQIEKAQEMARNWKPTKK